MRPVVEPLPVFDDNYSYVLTRAGQDRAVVVDPGDGAAVWALLEKKGYGLEAILATHHHFDHVAGIDLLYDRIPVEVCCFKGDLRRVPRASYGLEDGEVVEFAGLKIRALHVPGHTSGHVVYLCGETLFAGDTLFLGGCGRLFEGSAEQLYHSLYDKILPLPEETSICPGHEYTVRNRSFCLSIDAGNEALREELHKAETLRGKSLLTVPGLLKTEKETNIFLRSAEPAVIRAVIERKPGTPADPVSIFTQLRAMRDVY